MKIKSFLQLILIISTSLIYKNGFTQISKGGTPPSFFTEQLTDTVHVIQMPEIDIDSIIQNDTTNNNLMFRFGYAIDVDFGMDNSGTWDTLPNGDKIWRLKISSDGAYSINLIYDDFWMPEDAQFFVYSEDKIMILGAFTSLNNKDHNKFSTDLVKGDVINLEYYEPVYTSGGRINVDKVIHGYIDTFSHSSGLGQSGDCNIDVNCPLGDNWCVEKRAVSMILIDDNQALCSGSLINNVRQDLTPYYLTANHCLTGDEDTWFFRFKYWSPTCDQGDPPLHWVSISGSTIKANHADTDFALLELSVPPPSGFGVLYAGWDRTSTPATSATAIHHPMGDVMKISIDNNTIINIPEELCWDPPICDDITPPNTHWRATFDEGIVQHGSSGSPLFNQNHKVVGQLHGYHDNDCAIGDNYCFCNVQLPSIGEYGRFDVSWNLGLSTYLDPDNTGATSIGPTSPTIYLINRTLTDTHKFAALEKIHIEGNVETSGPICPPSNVPFTAEPGSDVEIKAKSIVIKPGTHFKPGSNVTITATDNIECADNIVEGDYVDVFCDANISRKMMIVEDNIFFADSAIIAENFNENITSEETKENDVVDTSDNIFLYPNPTKGGFTIELTDKKDSLAEIIIYNISGRIVFEKNNVSDDRIEVNICHLPKGIYIVQINRANIAHTQKIILR